MLDIEAIRKRAEAATKGPWEFDLWEINNKQYKYTAQISDKTGALAYTWAPFPQEERLGVYALRQIKDDAFFIAHARQDIPALIDELERTRAAARELREGVKRLIKYSHPVLSLEGNEATRFFSHSARIHTGLGFSLNETQWLEDEAPSTDEPGV